jgi:hypothetical protein
MRFTSYTDKQLEELNLIPNGEYKADVTSAEDKSDKNGSGMIVLNLNVYDANGRPRLMRDWLLESFPVKLKHFCYASGLEAKYDSGEITARDCVGKEIVVSIVTKPDENGKNWNRVNDYISVKKQSSANNDFTDSELPDLFA